MTEQESRVGCSRRSFVKGAAMIGAGALVGCGSAGVAVADGAAEVPETKIYAGACRSQCGQGCYLNVHVRDGQIVRTTAGHFEDGPEFDRIARTILELPDADEVEEDGLVDDDIINVGAQR